VEFKDEWDYVVKFAAKIWMNFYKFYAEAAKAKKFPVLFIRYEDIVKDCRTSLHDTFKFILGVNDLTGRYVEKRVDDII
jgi:predicted alpha/beta hydrolase